MTDNPRVPFDWPAGFNELPEEERAAILRERIRLLHIYGQHGPHDAVEIAGNRNALIALGAAIDLALSAGAGEVFQMTTDGEGYGVVVKLDDAPWDNPAWETKPLPYADPVARGKPDPAARIALLEFALRQANAQLVKRGVRPVRAPETEGTPHV